MRQPLPRRSSYPRLGVVFFVIAAAIIFLRRQRNVAVDQLIPAVRQWLSNLDHIVLLVAIIALLLVLVGLRLAVSEIRSHSAIGQALLSGAVFTLGIFVLEAGVTSKLVDQNNLRLEVGLTNDLTGFDCSKRDLSGYYLRDKTIHAANFHRANLSEADLRYVKGSGGVVFTHTNLTDAELRKAELENSKFSDADLTDADLSGAKLTNCAFVRTIFDRSILNGTHFGPGVERLENVESWKGAEADDCTCWPEGFHPRRAGIRISENEDTRLCEVCEAGTMTRPAIRGQGK